MAITPRGIGVVAISGLLYLTSVLLDFPEVATVALAGLAAVAMGFAAIVRRPRLEVARTITPTKVVRHKAAFGELHVRNLSLLPSAPVVAVEQCGPRPVPVNIRRMAPGASIAKRYKLPTGQRGVIPIGPLRLTRRDAFSLFERVQPQGEVTELWVQPLVHPLRTLPVGTKRSLDGPDEDRAPQGSITFDRLREWQMGDDPRHIHWRSSARTGSLIVREHVDTSLPRMVVVLDDRRTSMDADTFEEAVEVAASLLVTSALAGFPSSLVSACGSRANGRGSARDSARFLDELTKVQQSDDDRLAEAVVDATRAGGRGSLVIVTGAEGLSTGDGLLSARRRFENTTVVVTSSEEPAAPVAADVRWVWTPTGREFPSRWDRSA